MGVFGSKGHIHPKSNKKIDMVHEQSILQLVTSGCAVDFCIRNQGLDAQVASSCFGELGFVREYSECLSVDSSVDYVPLFFRWLF